MTEEKNFELKGEEQLGDKMSDVDNGTLFNEVVGSLNTWDYRRKESDITENERRYFKSIVDRIHVLSDSDFKELLVFMKDNLNTKVKDLFFVSYIAWIYSVGKNRNIKASDILDIVFTE